MRTEPGRKITFMEKNHLHGILEQWNLAALSPFCLYPLCKLNWTWQLRWAACPPPTMTAWPTSPRRTVLNAGPALIRPDKSGQAFIQIANCSPIEITIQRGEFIGLIENVQDCDKRHLNPSYITLLAEKNIADKVPIPLTKDKKLFIEEKAKLNMPEEFKDRYLNVLFKNH